MMTFWAPDAVLYIDAGLGFAWPSRAALTQVWTNPPFSSAPPNAFSYPLRVIGDTNSAVIDFVDTPLLLGSEFRFLSSVTFNNKGQIVRWIDYSYDIIPAPIRQDRGKRHRRPAQLAVDEVLWMFAITSGRSNQRESLTK